MPRVTMDDLVKAAVNWQEVDKSPLCKENFEAFMGATTRELANRGWTVDVSQHTGDRMFLLLSPHYKAIIKAWQAKQGSEK